MLATPELRFPFYHSTDEIATQAMPSCRSFVWAVYLVRVTGLGNGNETGNYYKGRLNVIQQMYELHY